MANEYRNVRDYFFGTLSTAAAISDTTLSSASFTTLGTVSATYLPLVLHDPATGVHEKIWMTAHTASASTATVERGKEGTSAVAWPAGTQVLCAPTIRDGLSVLTAASLPTDRHLGQRVAVSDHGRVAQWTFTAGWQADVGVAVPADFGLRQGGTALPNSSVIVMRGGQTTASTDASGQMQVTYTSPFPNQTLHSTVSWLSGGTAPYFSLGILSGSHTASGFKAYLYRSDTGASAPAGASVTFSYLATGY